MGYFDDLEFVRIKRQVSQVDQPLRSVSHGALGIMLGGGAFSVTEEGSRFFASPFVYWTLPCVPHAWVTPPGTTRENFWIALKGERMERIVSALHRQYPDNIIEISNPAPFLKLFEELTHLERRSHSFQEDMTLLVEKYVSLIYNEVRMLRSQDRYGALFSELCSKLQAHPEKQWDFTSWAVRHGISYDHFRKKFASYTGHPPHVYLMRCRFALAQELLHEENHSVKEVSFACGFDNVSNFIRFFKKHSGVSPAVWRQIHFFSA